MFGKVYPSSNVLPPVCIGTRMFSDFVVKVAKTETKGAAEDLIAEVESLAKFSHVNIVSILGFVHGPSPQDEESAYMMCLEYAESDLRKMLHERQDEVYGDYSQALMVKLATEVARGMTYIHGKLTTDDKMHLDLKPENVLLAKEGDAYIAKLADFGMVCEEDGEAKAASTMDAAEVARPNALGKTPRPACLFSPHGAASQASGV